MSATGSSDSLQWGQAGLALGNQDDQQWPAADLVSLLSNDNGSNDNGHPLCTKSPTKTDAVFRLTRALARSMMGAMTYPRSILVPPGSPGTFHCVSRCVRRAFLCGEDRLTGRSFEHRRQWVEDRIHQLAGIFGVSIWGPLSASCLPRH